MRYKTLHVFFIQKYSEGVISSYGKKYLILKLMLGLLPFSEYETLSSKIWKIILPIKVTPLTIPKIVNSIFYFFHKTTLNPTSAINPIPIFNPVPTDIWEFT